MRTIYVHNYLNLPHVQKALHANLTNLPNPWDPCSNLDWKDSPSSMFPIYRRLIASGLRILLYSLYVISAGRWIYGGV
ncbi:hypothetical protein RND71_041726 [Anisodus tanguticus]|uniref:Uncharacterized protein n=1 Tax=Anisodus tanguticus TaxID=243964 RepID=A0AAE1QVY9_9SOLA|nr:hypothetical protein RND71_041726 [Anisodus tanguticus]